MGCLASTGCATLIQRYSVREHEVVFVQSQGNSYSLGDCKRDADGKLSDCKAYPTDFQ